MKYKMGMWFSLDSTFEKFLLISLLVLGTFTPFMFGGISIVHPFSTLDAKEKNKISSTGSTSMSHIVSILSDDFMSIHPEYIYEKSETGSGSAPLSVVSGQYDLGDMSRYMKDCEKSENLVTNCIALDGVVVILNDKNPIDNLSIQNLKDIFSKKITDWSEISDQFSGKIVTIGREEASGTREGFEQGISIENPNYDIILSESGDIAVKVSNEERSIGYISMASSSNGIHKIKIDNIECNFENIKSGLYPLIRPFLQIYIKYDENDPEKKSLNEWSKYLRSDRAKKLIEEEKLIYVQESEG